MQAQLDFGEDPLRRLVRVDTIHPAAVVQHQVRPEPSGIYLGSRTTNRNSRARNASSPPITSRTSSLPLTAVPGRSFSCAKGRCLLSVLISAVWK